MLFRSKQRVDQTLNLLDGLEKLTSKTVGTSKNGVRLEIPQVTARTEWHVQQKPGEPPQVEFQFRGSRSQVDKVQAQLQVFSHTQPSSAPRLNCTEQQAHGQGYSRTLTLTVPSDQIQRFAEMLDYKNIMAFKHPPYAA